MDRQPGRRRHGLAAELPEPVRLWAEVLRRTVFTPLTSGERRLTLEKIADRLEAMAPDEASAVSGKLADILLSGRGETSVQRMQAGRLVPTRDVVRDLLQMVEEECGAPSEEDVRDLWAAHMPALEAKRPDTSAFYTIFDANAVMWQVAGIQQEQISALRGEVVLYRERGGIAKALPRRTRRAQALVRQAVAKEKTRQLHGRQEALQQSVLQWSGIVATLELRVVDAENKLAGWQELSVRLQEQREQSAEQALRDSEVWAEREALLLERLAQACDALQDAAAQAYQAETALRLKEQWWQQQADAAHADAEAARVEAATQQSRAAAARAEAEAVRVTALRTLQEQQVAFEGFAAQAEAHHAHALQSVQHLETRLREAHLELEQSRDAAVQADTQLTSFLSERHLLQELDAIISLALAKHRDPGPPALSRFAAPPASTQMPSSQHQVSAAGQPSDVLEQDSTSPAGESQSSPDSPSLYHADLPGPDVSTSTGPTPPSRPDAGQVQPPRTQTNHTANARRRPVSPAVLARRVSFIAAPLMCFTAIVSNLGSGEAPTDDTSRTGADAPGRGTMADLGERPVNTAAVMHLPPCKEGDTTQSLKPDHTAYPSTKNPIFTFTVIGRDGIRCRINVVHSQVSLTVESAEGGGTLWDSGSCTSTAPSNRWIAVSHASPAELVYRWDRTFKASCTSESKPAPSGTYIVTASRSLLPARTIASFKLLLD